MTIIKHTFIALGVSALLGTTMASGASAETPTASAINSVASVQSKQEFMDSMTKKVLSILKDQHKSFEQKQTMLRSIFVDTVDTDWIAKFVLGKAWKEANDDQKSRYTELYRTYLTGSYVSKFDEESGAKVKDIKVISVKELSKDQFTAKTEIVQTQGENVKVDYTLKQKDDRFKIIDINIEGVSLLATHRSEFNAMAGSGGIDAVIKKLTELTTTPPAKG